MTPNQLIIDHIKYAKTLAFKIKQERGLPIDLKEIYSVAMLALVKAANTYDNGKSGFKTHAWRRIRGDIEDFARKEYRRNNGTNKNFIIHIEDLNPFSYKKLSLCTDGTEKRVINKELVDMFMAGLSKRESIIMQQYFGEGYTLREIAKHLNLSGERIRQIKHRMIKKKRKVLFLN